MTSWIKPVLGGLVAVLSHLTAYFKGKKAGRGDELRRAAKEARKRGDGEELRSIIRRSHGD